MDSCAKHPHEPGRAICRRCGGSWCNDCLVYSFGPKKPPYCMGCAMVAGGVRTSAARPAMPKRELKALLKIAKAEAKSARSPKSAKPGTAPEPTSDDTPASAVSDVAAELPAEDWDQPWWEERQPTFAE